MNTPLALSVNEFSKLEKQPNTIVLDVRSQQDFIKSHIPNAIFIGLDGLFEPWVELFIDNSKYQLILIIPEGRVIETFDKLKKINYTNCIGYLKDGFASWENAQLNVDSITSISANKLETLLKSKDITVYDIRKINEYNDGHLKDVIFSPLTALLDNIDQFKSNDDIAYIHCGGGYRSVIACSILKRNNIHDVVDIAGGMAHIKRTDITLQN